MPIWVIIKGVRPRFFYLYTSSKSKPSATDRSFPVSEVAISSIPNIPSSFLDRYSSIAKDSAKPDIQSQSPVSLTSEGSLLIDKSPDAFTDTYGTISGAPLVYKTGPSWSKRGGGPEAQPYVRELRSIHGHPIMTS